ncbi:Wzz/FepE/Etk N-terminal domain-containing protein [Frankia sp. AgKG'84/4]|uniref:Wzz/FepE/Etk N-terminal domain-containing protein n=1 Tax=Frankia sp. AgKG'84/4 TaxID=573490 RepID=UPI00200CC866|nr:Wzz/FepE/Etk N-terminal domain-containing protein [Frankia sp. AgKG'84/4]MCL9795048.1 Wzz/FepE/Etk N-terminal domain-containing protein [Frankia sp. AgKG'84/4]
MSRAAQSTGETSRAPSAPSLLRILQPRLLIIAIVVVIFAALAAIYSKAQSATYTASARVFLSTDDATLGANSVDATRYVQTQAQFAESSAAVADIAKNLKLTDGDVTDRLSTTPSDSGYFFVIKGKGSTQDAAISLVKAAESAYSTLLTSYGANSQESVNALIKLRDQLVAENAAAQTTGTNDVTVRNSQIGTLNTKIAEAQTAAVLGTSAIKLAEPPVAGGQGGPNLLRNTIVAALVGLLGAIAAIWIMYQRRPTILDPHNPSDALGVPLIAALEPTRTTASAAETLVSAMSAVMSPTSKVVAFTPASRGDLAADLVASVAAAWSDDQGVVLILDTSPSSDVRASLEGLPRPTSGELPRWAHEPTCLARSSGTGRGHILYNRVSPARAARPGGLAPILADRAPVVDLVILVTSALEELPMTAASAIQADAVVVITSPETHLKELEQVPRDWPALAERVVGVVHDGRTGVRRVAGATSERRSSVEPITSNSPVGESSAPPKRGAPDAEPTDRYARPAR